MDRLTPRVRVVQVLSVSALLLAWEGVARAGWVDPLFVPAPSAVLRAFGRIGGAALAGLGDTLLKTAIAYVLAVVIGVGVIVARAVRTGRGSGTDSRWTTTSVILSFIGAPLATATGGRSTRPARAR